MTQVRDEQWIKEKYEALHGTERVGYALVSMKIKRFRILTRLYGREATDQLSRQVYDAVERWLGPDEYLCQAGIAYYNLLLKIPFEKTDREILERVTDLNRQIRDLPNELFGDKVFCGYGVHMLTAEDEPFYHAQYAADICRAECPERTFRNSHMEIYGRSYQDPNLLSPGYESKILPALEQGHVKLYLQPKVDLKTGEVYTAEALMRWIDPELGNIPVGDFLPTLEERGLISEVDLYLFDQVCSSAERWHRDYGKKIQVSVNLSRNQFNYPMFLDDYRKVFERYHCDKNCIEFELMESIILNKAERVSEVVSELMDYGFSCSLDDFGSGFSSYGVLTMADLSVLKLDRSLFRNEHNERERTLISHIIKTAHGLGMQAVAEGVETRGYVDFLREAGCDFIQGFVFFKPMPIEEFEERFIRGNEKVSL